MAAERVGKNKAVNLVPHCRIAEDVDEEATGAREHVEGRNEVAEGRMEGGGKSRVFGILQNTCV